MSQADSINSFAISEADSISDAFTLHASLSTTVQPVRVAKTHQGNGVEIIDILHFFQPSFALFSIGFALLAAADVNSFATPTCGTLPATHEN